MFLLLKIKVSHHKDDSFTEGLVKLGHSRFLYMEIKIKFKLSCYKFELK